MNIAPMKGIRKEQIKGIRKLEKKIRIAFPIRKKTVSAISTIMRCLLFDANVRKKRFLRIESHH